jgi:hypothetical protein
MGDGVQADLGQVPGLSNDYHQKKLTELAYRDREKQ